MKRRHAIFLIFTLLLSGFFSGCFNVHLGGRTPRDRLKETVVEGKGWEKIIILDITGFLSDIPASRPFSPPVTVLSDIKEKLRKIEKDKRVRGIVLRINSPGGTVTAADTMFREIRRLKTKRELPVVALMMDAAASGGYYVAVAADRIYAQPTTITGSIGVIVQKFNVHDLLSRIGVQSTPVKSGSHKDMGSPFRPVTEEETRLLQEAIDALHGRFVDTVSERREGLTRDQVATLADGRIYTAGQALEHGLVDAIGYLDDAIEGVKEMAGIDAARVVLYNLPYAYKENIYSSPALPPVTEINLLTLGHGFPWTGSPFLYLWDPLGAH